MLWDDLTSVVRDMSPEAFTQVLSEYAAKAAPKKAKEWEKRRQEISKERTSEYFKIIAISLRIAYQRRADAFKADLEAYLRAIGQDVPKSEVNLIADLNAEKEVRVKLRDRAREEGLAKAAIALLDRSNDSKVDIFEAQKSGLFGKLCISEITESELSRSYAMNKEIFDKAKYPHWRKSNK